MESGLALYSRWSLYNSPDRRAIIVLKAGDYRRDKPGGKFDLEAVVMLKQEEVRDMCQKLPDVQGLTDKAVRETKPKDQFARPSEYGTAIHTYIQREINKKPDPDFVAEISHLKYYEEVKREADEAKHKPTDEQKNSVPYATKDSIRVDVLERTEDKTTACVYDIKTGEGPRSGLSALRMAEIAASVLNAYKYVLRIIVTEVRPTSRQPSRK